MESLQARFHIMDCHETLRVSRNDEKQTIASLREVVRLRGNL
ncbi:hypothetical protein [Helicobacter rodentium]|nr:hypothetical protein [Helicobacter rodentium]